MKRLIVFVVLVAGCGAPRPSKFVYYPALATRVQLAEPAALSEILDLSAVALPGARRESLLLVNDPDLQETRSRCLAELAGG